MTTWADELTAEALRLLFDYNQESGEFTSRRKTSAKHVGERVGARRVDGYLQLYVKGHNLLAHRLAFLHVTGFWPRGQIDHINGNRADNRWANLREVSCLVNNQNIRNVARGSKVCEMLGAERRGRRYRARIVVEGTLIHLGNFDSADQANAAYIDAKRRYHLGCTI